MLSKSLVKRLQPQLQHIFIVFHCWQEPSCQHRYDKKPHGQQPCPVQSSVRLGLVTIKRSGIFRGHTTVLYCAVLYCTLGRVTALHTERLLQIYTIYIPLDRKSQKSTKKRTQESNRAQKVLKKVMKLKKVLKKANSQKKALKKVMNSKRNSKK